MKTELINKNWIRIALITCLVFLSLSLVNSKALAQADPEGEDPIGDRQDLDKEQIDAEAKELADLQKKDYEECDQESETIEDPEKSGGGEGSPTNDSYDSNNPDNPNGDVDGDGIPNSEDNYNDNTDTPTTPPGEISPACADGDTAGYVAANEGVRNSPYTDSEGYRTIGIGHKVTGNEPFPCDRAITDEQVGQLYDADTTTARNCARRSATEHGVDYDALSPERQTVVTDMSFNMGCQGNGGINEFDDMWGNMADAQRTGSQDSWDAAGDEIMDSRYGRQTGNRASRNGDIMRTSDGGKIDERISQDPDAQGYCGGGMTAWARPLELFAKLFQAPLALAQTYVPVQEQAGELMDHAKATETNTKDTAEDTENIRLLSIQICTHLKAIHRIQERFELKMVEDATVMKIKSTEIEKYRQASFGETGLIKTGYATLDENGEQIKSDDTEKGLPLYVTNNEMYIKDARYEGEKKAIDDIRQSYNLYNDATLIDMQAEVGSSGLNSEASPGDISNVLGINSSSDGAIPTAQNNLDNIPVLSKILRPIRNTLAWFSGNKTWAAATSPSDSGTISDDQFWNSFINVVQNSPEITYLRNAGYIEKKQNEAILAARDTAAQGQGFLPVRACLAKTLDGKTCTVWGTVQPGVIVKEAQTAAMNSRLRIYEQATNMGEITQGNEPNIQELLFNKPVAGGGGAQGPGMTTPEDLPDIVDGLTSDPETNVPPDNGGNTDGSGNGNSGGGGGTTGDGGSGGTDWTDLTDLLGGLYGSDDNADPGSDPTIQAILELLKVVLDNSRPWIIFKAKDKENDSSLIYWYAPNASECITTNNWLHGNGVKFKDKGADLTISSSTRVTIKSGESGSYQIKCTNSRGSRERTLPVRRD